MTHIVYDISKYANQEFHHHRQFNDVSAITDWFTTEAKKYDSEQDPFERRLGFFLKKIKQPGCYYVGLPHAAYAISVVVINDDRVAELEAKLLDAWNNDDIEFDLAKAKKRIVELETLTSDCHDVMVACKRRESDLREQVEDLKSQLSWTDIDEGLPTKLGFYLFEHTDAGLGLYQLVESELYPWRNVEGTRRTSENMRRLYERFRRIEI